MTGYPELTRNYQSDLCAPRWAWQSSWEAFHSSTAGASRLALPPQPAVMVNLTKLLLAPSNCIFNLFSLTLAKSPLIVHNVARICPNREPVPLPAWVSLVSAGPYCGASRRLNETTHLAFEVKGFSLTTDLRFQKNVPSLCGFSF